MCDIKTSPKLLKPKPQRLWKRILPCLVVVALLVAFGSVAVSASSTGSLRFIQLQYLDTLNEDSKWNQEPLKSKLINALSNDLSDTNNCEQVWYFPAEPDPESGYKSFEEVHNWCLEHDKGEQTNQAFLDEFEAGHKIQPIPPEE